MPTQGPAIQCESYNVLVTLLKVSNMVGILTNRLLSTPLVGDFLEEIPVKETLPAYTTHLIARAAIPLSRPAASMARMIVLAARRLAKAA